MITLLTIFQYLVAAIVADKFLVSKRKIRPLSYTFYTVVMGIVLVMIWPWVYASIPFKSVFLDMLSGALFSLAMYAFFRALSEGEVSRVIPFVFGIVPVFDIIIGRLSGHDILRMNEIAALFLLIPGALLITYRKNKFLGKHVVLKVTTAFLFSCYYALWQYAAQTGPVLNSLIWNRIGAAAVLVSLLAVPAARREIFKTEHIKHKEQTSVVFLLKQIVGGLNFYFLSFLFVYGKISVINSLQGFRYAFLFIISLFLSKKYKHILDEDVDKHTLRQKTFALALIFLGTLVLFL